MCSTDLLPSLLIGRTQILKSLWCWVCCAWKVCLIVQHPKESASEISVPIQQPTPKPRSMKCQVWSCPCHARNAPCLKHNMSDCPAPIMNGGAFYYTMWKWTLIPHSKIRASPVKKLERGAWIHFGSVTFFNTADFLHPVILLANKNSASTLRRFLRAEINYYNNNNIINKTSNLFF